MANADSDEVCFIREAFGARTCCTLNSWTVVITFTKMVYSCFLLGIASLILSLCLASDTISIQFSSPMFLMIGIPSFIFAIIFAVLTSHVFICVAGQKSDPDKLCRYILHFSIYKGISTTTFLALPLIAQYKFTISVGVETLINSLITCDAIFALLYILLVILYIQSRRKEVDGDFSSGIATIVFKLPVNDVIIRTSTANSFSQEDCMKDSELVGKEDSNNRLLGEVATTTVDKRRMMV